MALFNNLSPENLPLDLDPDFCFSMSEFDLDGFTSEDLFQDDSYQNGFLDISPAINLDEAPLCDINVTNSPSSNPFPLDTKIHVKNEIIPIIHRPNSFINRSYSQEFMEESAETTPTSDEYLSFTDSSNNPIIDKHSDESNKAFLWDDKGNLPTGQQQQQIHHNNNSTNAIFLERRTPAIGGGVIKHNPSFSRLERLSHNGQPTSITISLNGMNNSYDNHNTNNNNNNIGNTALLRTRQQCGVMSGRIKKKDSYYPLIQVKRSPSQSPLPSEDNNGYYGHDSHLSIYDNSGSLRIRPAANGNGSNNNNSNTNATPRHYPITALTTSSNGSAATPSSISGSLSRNNLLRPIPTHSRTSSNNHHHNNNNNSSSTTATACYKLSSAYRSDNSSSLLHSIGGLNDACDASTCSSSSSTHGGGGGNGRGNSPSASSLFQNSLCGQSDLLPITEEEIRVMTCEGYPIPSSLPLTKADEKNLKKVRRKIKNKRSAQESRRKKKEYVERLEKHADALSQENMALRRRLEDMERRIELSEVRNRQLVNRLCKNGNNNNNNNGKCDSSTPSSTAGSVNGNTNGNNNSNNVNGINNNNSNNNTNHGRPHGRNSYSPPTSTTNSANSTKFYIVAFVLLFSVLFAGDPTFLMRAGVDSPLSIGGVGLRSYYYSSSRAAAAFSSSSSLFSSSSSLSSSSLSLSLYKWESATNGFRGFFCPAGLYHCRYGTSKSAAALPSSMELAYLRNSNKRNSRWFMTRSGHGGGGAGGIGSANSGSVNGGGGGLGDDSLGRTATIDTAAGNSDRENRNDNVVDELWKPIVPHTKLKRVNNSLSRNVDVLDNLDETNTQHHGNHHHHHVGQVFLPQPYSTKSILLDAHDVDDGLSECSILAFWKKIWYSDGGISVDETVAAAAAATDHDVNGGGVGRMFGEEDDDDNNNNNGYEIRKPISELWLLDINQNLNNGSTNIAGSSNFGIFSNQTIHSSPSTTTSSNAASGGITYLTA